VINSRALSVTVVPCRATAQMADAADSRCHSSPSAAQTPLSRLNETADSSLGAMRKSTNSVTSWSACSAGSKTGERAQRASIATSKPSWQPSPSPQPASAGLTSPDPNIQTDSLPPEGKRPFLKSNEGQGERLCIDCQTPDAKANTKKVKRRCPSGAFAHQHGI
jgi:hypothetical protein